MKTNYDEPAVSMHGPCSERRGNIRGFVDTNRPASAFRQWGWRVAASLLLFLAYAHPAAAQMPSGFISSDQITGHYLDANDRSAVVLIHGWTAEDLQNAPISAFDGSDWLQLISALQTRLNGTGTKLILFHWEDDASTGPVSIDLNSFFGRADFNAAFDAASNGFLNGDRLAAQLNQAAPDLRRVTLIAHSAGAWVAYRAVDMLLKANPYVVVNMVLLDPFIPGVDPTLGTSLTTATMGSLANHASNDRIYRLENYFSIDASDNALVVGGGSNATSQVFPWRSGDINGPQIGQQINQRVDYQLSPGTPVVYGGHDGPKLFFADTVTATTQGATIPSRLYLAPWNDYTSIGFFRGLVNEEFLLPSITVQPQAPATPATLGSTVTLSVSTTHADSNSFQWFKDDQPYPLSSPATSSTLTLSAITAADAGSYVVRVKNAAGLTFSEKAVIEIAPENNPMQVTGIVPSSGSPQGGTPVTITGSGFAAGAFVAIGGVQAANVVVVSATTITAVTGAHVEGAVNVFVANQDAHTSTLPEGFTYTTKVTPVITWSDPAPIGYGTALSGTQLNASSAVAGTMVYTPPAGTILNVGASQTLSVTFTPTDTTTYTTATASVTIDVVAAGSDGDDSSRTATELTAGQTATGFISSSTDVDWFKIDVITPGTLIFNLTVPAGKNYDLELYGGANPVFIKGSYGDSSLAESITYNATTIGTYYVRVYGYPIGNGSFSATAAYSLTVNMPTVKQFSQQGPKLVGTGAVGVSQQGSSVSLSADGNTVIVGGAADNSDAGAAWVWTRSGGVWTQQGSKLVGSGAVGNAGQGFSVSLSADGNTAIIGGPGDDNSVGAAWVWTKSGGVWTQQGNKLVGSGAVGNAHQGASVSLSADGDTAIIGAYGDDSGAGAAWVWTRSGGVWSQQGAKLVGAGAVGPALQGISASLSADGNTAIVGGRWDNSNAGAAWIWTRTGGVWTQQGTKLVGAGAVGIADQGYSVSLSADGNTAIVGGITDNSSAGAVWIWTRSGGAWTQQGTKLVGSGTMGGGAAQGWSVSLSADGNAAIVGGLGDGGGAGAAWVWTRSGGVWTQQGIKLVGSGAVGSAGQGNSVALSADGNTALVGGLYDSSRAGAAWVFTVPAHPLFTQQGPKLVGTGAVGPNQGYSVSVSADGSTAIVGGIGDNDGVGAAWVWTRIDGVWTQQGSKLVGSAAIGAQVYQGYSVAISADGNTAVVGGPGDNGGAGAVWVWTRSGGVWTQQGTKLVGSDAVQNVDSGRVNQGWSVSISADGNVIVVGGIGDNSSTGAAWVWTRIGGVWTQQGAKLVGSFIAGRDIRQGSSVSLSGDGNTLIVGGAGQTHFDGAAWVWTRSGGVWIQQGTKLVGSGGVDPGGGGNPVSVSLSADGNTAIVGEASDNSNFGAAWVWTRSGGVWTQQGNKLLGSGVTGSVGQVYQGNSVSLSADGNTAIVGGPGDGGGTGAVWVWTRSGGIWAQLGTKLVGSGAMGGANQGASVSLSADGNTAIVGGYSDNSSVGAVWVFAASVPVTPAITTQPANQAVAAGANATFTVAASGTPAPRLQWQVSTDSGSSWSDLANNNLYSGVTTGTLSIAGASVALNGYQYRCVATNSSDSTNSTAAVLTVNAPPTAQFTQQGQKLVGTGAVGVSRQGSSVSVSADGNTVIVGGAADNSNAGAAWVWTRSGGVWTQQGAKLVGSGAVGNVGQGYSVSLSADGNTAIVGGAGDNGNAGAAWIWTRSGGVWTQQGTKLVGAGAVGTDIEQGISVSLSADGNTAIVGGYVDNNQAGAVWVWTRSGGVWTQQGTKLVGSGAVGNAYQGFPVSLSADGNTAIVGGFGDNNGTGAVWVWTRTGGVWTQQGPKLVGSEAVEHGCQGYSASLSGDGNTAIVGDYGGNDPAGSVWVWTRSGGVWSQQGPKLVGSGASGIAHQGFSVSLSADGNAAIVGGFWDNSYAGAAWVWRRSGGVWTQYGTKLVGSGAEGAEAGQGRSVALSADGNTAIVGGIGDNNSVGAVWVFTASAPVAPTITTQPTDQAVTSGANATFTVAASGTPTSTLQWQVSANGGSSWSDLADNNLYSGVTTETLSITGATIALNGYQFRCTVANGVNPSLYSNAVTLTVTKASQSIDFAGPSDRGFSADPIGLTASATSGLPVTFSVVSGPATIAGSTLTVTGIGTVVVRASQSGDSNYQAAQDVERSIVIFASFAYWQQTRFTAAELADSNLSGAAVDTDHDGIKNLLEYALALDPKRSDRNGLPAGGTFTVGSQRYLTLTYPHQKAASDLTYTVEASGDLVAWSMLNPVTVTTVDQGTTETLTVCDTVPIGSMRSRFLRLSVSTQSTTATTPPVGAVAIPTLANSDTLVSMPLARASVYEDTLSAVNGTVLAMSGTPGWTTNQFVKSLPSQLDTYCVQFKTGSAAGHFYTVTANAVATLTVDWNGETPSVVAGDQFELTPYWTLGTLFPATDAGVSFTASTSSLLRNTELLFPDLTSVGINLPAASTYYFFNGAWRKVGQPATTSFDSTVLTPDSYFLQRNKAAASQLTIMGSVVTGPLAAAIIAQGGSTKQDNPIALRFGGTVTLAQSNLVASGAFQASSSSLLRKDELYVFDNTASGINKPAAATYYFFNGAWRKVGSAATLDFGADAVFTPGTGVILRKAGTGAGNPAQDYFWIYNVTGL